MQVINSLLALLVFPVEKEKVFFRRYAAAPLAYPPDFPVIRNALPGFPLLPSLTVHNFKECCRTLTEYRSAGALRWFQSR